MTVRYTGRRFFMLGAGGLALAIPALPSLFRDSRAQAQAMGTAKRFVCVRTTHGGVWNQNMFPAQSMASTPLSVYDGLHDAHYGTLTGTSSGGETALSPVLRAPSSLLSSRIIGKMNTIEGLDFPYYLGHNAANLGAVGESDQGPQPPQASIDQIMAYSSSFYSSTPLKRTICLGGRGMSVEWVNPSTRSGGFQVLPIETSSLSLFRSLYVAPPDETPMASRPPVVDRVLESYRRLESGAFGAGRRLGSEDRHRLRDYMDRLSQIQSAMMTPTAASCGDVVPPMRDSVGNSNTYATERAQAEPQWAYDNIYSLFIDVAVAAFMCDTSRIFTWDSPDDFNAEMRYRTETDGGNTGFHAVAHLATSGNNAELEAQLQTTSRNFFRYVFLDIVNKMDSVMDADGSTILDNSLVFMTSESGGATHDNDSTPVVMAGSAGGFLHTGMHVDFRDRNLTIGEGTGLNEYRRKGICYYQWLTTCLDAMGIPRSEWQTSSPAYGPFPATAGWEATIPQDAALFERMCDRPLPIITG